MSSKLSYKDAGVDIAAADAFVGRIAALAKSTHTDGVVPHRTEYAGLYRPPLAGMRDPLIAATCDGVGTKLLVARDMQRYTDLGQDLVGMNVNDLLPAGARPLLFLDYIATGKLDPQALEDIVTGIARACRLAGCALLGGETAEMPGAYKPGDFDLAGFAVGIVDGDHVPDVKQVAVGDQILALPATGVHSNGLSLARKALLERGGLRLDDSIPELDRSLGEELLVPTPIYVQQVLQLLQLGKVKAGAHVTGGGILGRGERLLQAGQRMVLHQGTYRKLPIFDLIARSGNVDPSEMGRTFNMGLGYLAIVNPETVTRCLQEMPGAFLHVGEIVAGERGVVLE